MFARALKSNVIISLVVFLFIGMVLIDFVVVRTFQRQIIQNGIDKTAGLFLLVENELSHLDNISRFPLSTGLANKVRPFSKQKNVTCAYISSLDQNLHVAFGEDCDLKPKFEDWHQQAIQTNQRQINFEGRIWGVFLVAATLRHC